MNFVQRKTMKSIKVFFKILEIYFAHEYIVGRHAYSSVGVFLLLLVLSLLNIFQVGSLERNFVTWTLQAATE